MTQDDKLTKEHFYQWFKLLIVAIVILNTIDVVTTLIGVYYFDGLQEGNPLLGPLLENIHLFLVVKFILLSGMFLAALGYILKIHHAFPKLWENEVGVFLSSVVVMFYLFVVSNNVILIIANL